MEIHSKIEQRHFDDPGKNHLIGLAAGEVNYWTSFISDPLTIGFFLFWEAAILRSSIISLSVGYGSGLLSWSLLEYTFHRWVYHKGRSPAHTGHKIHHESPEMLIAMPWFIVTAFLAGVWYIFAYLLQFHFILSFMAGLTSGFVFYGVFHHIHHHFNFKNRRYRKLRAHHFIHHQFPDVNFGVTSRLWDQVFGTTHRARLKKKKSSSSFFA
jgi:sterol desaturase/sphingolipid hydroxylase (fatty acid hydroxylase superfamily)